MIAGRFQNLGSAGDSLAVVVSTFWAEQGKGETPLVVAIIPNGAPVALPVAAALGVRAESLSLNRTDCGVDVDHLPDVAGRTVIVIDDGVETGTVARCVIAAMRAGGAARVILAVPVCSREVLAPLALMYDDVIAVVKPLARRSLAWHFDDFDTIDDARAHAVLAAQG